MLKRSMQVFFPTLSMPCVMSPTGFICLNKFTLDVCTCSRRSNTKKAKSVNCLIRILKFMLYSSSTRFSYSRAFGAFIRFFLLRPSVHVPFCSLCMYYMYFIYIYAIAPLQVFRNSVRYTS